MFKSLVHTFKSFPSRTLAWAVAVLAGVATLLFAAPAARAADGDVTLPTGLPDIGAYIDALITFLGTNLGKAVGLFIVLIAIGMVIMFLRSGKKNVNS